MDALRDERVRNLAQRVDIHEDAELTRMWPDSLAARVEIEFVDGIKARGDCRDPIGTRGRLDTSEAVRAKYNSLLAGVLPRDHADALWSAVQSLEDVSDVRHLFEAGRTLTRGQTVAAAATAALVRGGGGRRSAESHQPSIPAGIDRTP